MRHCAPTVFLFLTTFATQGLAQEVVGSGFLPGGWHTEAVGVSSDGRVVVGAASDSQGVGRAYWWAPNGLIQDIGYGAALGANADGSVIVGFTMAGGAFRWSASSGVEPLPQLPFHSFSAARAISVDGTTVVGSSIYQMPEEWSTSRACRWTGAGVEDLGSFLGRNFLVAFGVSADGNVVAGTASISGGPTDADRAWRWTAATGLQPIGTLGTASSAAAVSGDGAVIVGASTLPGGFTRAFRWTTSEGMQSLGTIPGGDWSSAAAVNRDGTAIVGSGMSGGESHALLWSPRTGVVDLNTYLPSIGISVDPWILGYANAISANGRVIAGVGKRGANWEGWTVTLPCYANCDASSNPPLLTANDFQCFLNKFAAGDAQANCDGSTATPTLTANDFQCFLNQFAIGCD